MPCLLYTSDAADELDGVDLGGRRIIKKKFFQAEDGIRDQPRSRGLGDVYKRQLGGCAGAWTTTAALGAIQDAVESETPALGYTVTYAVGNTLLIIWGVVIVLLI